MNRSSARSFAALSLSGAATAAVTALIVAPTASWAAAMGTKSKPAVEDCGLPPAAVKPKSLVLACADAGEVGVDLEWRTWGSGQAFATGVYTWHVCTPSCVASNKWEKASATFALEQPALTKDGWLFEKLVVHITGRLPSRMPKQLVFIWKPVPRR